MGTDWAITWAILHGSRSFDHEERAESYADSTGPGTWTGRNINSTPECTGVYTAHLGGTFRAFQYNKLDRKYIRVSESSSNTTVGRVRGLFWEEPRVWA